MERDDFHNKFKGRNLDDKYKFIRKHYENPDLFAGDFALNITEELFRLSPRGDREEDFISFIDEIRENRPDLYQQNDAWFLRYQLVMKLGIEERLTEEEITDLSDAYVEHIDVVDSVWKGLLFHGPIDDLLDFVRLTAPRIKNNRSIMESGIVRFLEKTFNIEIYKRISQSDGSLSGEAIFSELRSRFEDYIEDSPIDELSAENHIEWIDGILGNEEIKVEQDDPSDFLSSGFWSIYQFFARRTRLRLVSGEHGIGCIL